MATLPGTASRWLLLPFLALLAALMLSAACGGDDDDGGADATRTADAGDDASETPEGSDGPAATAGGEAIEVCTLVSEADVGEIVGETVTALENTVAPFYGCSYTTDASDIFYISVYSAERHVVERAFEVGNEDLEAIEGLGEAAVWNSQFAALDVLQGNYEVTVTISATALSDEDEKAAALDLAQTTLDRLD